MQQDQQETGNIKNGNESGTPQQQENAAENNLVLQQGEIKNNDHDPQAGNPASGKEARNSESGS